MKKSFLDRIQSGEKLVADGATGSNLQKRGLSMGVASERWVLENPEQILRLHSDFISAGSDIILTCTFGGSSIRLEQSGLADKIVEINTRAVELARQAAGDKVYVAGSVGPLGHLLKPLGPVEEEDAFKAFQQQIQTLDAAGVDLLVIETQFDLAEAGIAIKAAHSVSKLPLVCSFSYDRGTRTMMGVKPSQAGQELTEAGVDLIGINCGRSLNENLSALQMLRKSTDLPIWFKPNAGSPGLDDQGKPVYSLKPEEMGAEVSKWLAEGASVVGGCCGTSPEHLAAIASEVKQTRVL
jgi:5-methyltetrahydrofolate--homocysteine methyltransferase